MSTAQAQGRVGRVEFTGSRHELMLVILRGYTLMIPTLGLYRFWLATWKRRFYWQNTIIDGDPLEYTGNANQLLLGFLFSLAFFLPIYIALFYVSMQDPHWTLFGYLGAGAALWFLAGYAIYRARDFRLSRTLWRGIRFDQKGNGWVYALRRFVWSVPMVLTIGLIYPWMASSLWHYRWRNCWYGDRRLDIAGNWRVFALPYYVTYLINAVAIVATVTWIENARSFIQIGAIGIPAPLQLLGCLGCALVFALSLAWYRATTATRMLSSVSLGEAKLTLNVPPTSLFAQYIAYAALVLLFIAAIALVLLIALAALYATAAQNGRVAETSILDLLQHGTINVVLVILLYLVVLGTLGLLAELVLGLGWWRLLARGATIENPDSLLTVKATVEDRTLVGQGLADALNVGAY